MLGWVIAYFVLGIFSGLWTSHLFPPENGFRPSLPLRASAVLVFTLLWPVLVLISLVYGIGFAYRCYIGEESVRLVAGWPFAVRQRS